MHMKWLVLSLLIVFATACDTTHCTDQGCSSGFQLSFNAENDSLSQGDYTISIRTEDNEQMACSFTLVETGAICSTMACVQNLSCDVFQKNDGPSQEVVYYSPSEEKAILSFPQLEGELQISIMQNGEPLVGLTTSPVYEKNQPNGPNCGPTCFNAATEITINRD